MGCQRAKREEEGAMGCQRAMGYGPPALLSLPHVVALGYSACVHNHFTILHSAYKITVLIKTTSVERPLVMSQEWVYLLARSLLYR
jgi:hypothetical protein